MLEGWKDTLHHHVMLVSQPTGLPVFSHKVVDFQVSKYLLHVCTSHGCLFGLWDPIPKCSILTKVTCPGLRPLSY